MVVTAHTVIILILLVPVMGTVRVGVGMWVHATLARQWNAGQRMALQHMGMGRWMGEGTHAVGTGEGAEDRGREEGRRLSRCSRRIFVMVVVVVVAVLLPLFLVVVMARAGVGGSR